jgi:hypothetical protein
VADGARRSGNGGGLFRHTGGAVDRKPRCLAGWLRIIFAGLIFLCGVSQFLDVIVIWRPVYWWLASELTLCGFVSLATLYYLPIAITALQRAETDAEPPRPPAD